jgi:hypothetical protein
MIKFFPAACARWQTSSVALKEVAMLYRKDAPLL